MIFHLPLPNYFLIYDISAISSLVDYYFFCNPYIISMFYLRSLVNGFVRFTRLVEWDLALQWDVWVTEYGNTYTGWLWWLMNICGQLTGKARPAQDILLKLANFWNMIWVFIGLWSMATGTRIMNFANLVMVTQYLLLGKAFWSIANHTGACLDYDQLWTW